MQRIKVIVLGALLAISASAGTAARADCCYPGTKFYYNQAGAVVGFEMIGCGDDSLHGQATSKW